MYADSRQRYIPLFHVKCTNKRLYRDYITRDYITDYITIISQRLYQRLDYIIEIISQIYHIETISQWYITEIISQIISHITYHNRELSSEILTKKNSPPRRNKNSTAKCKKRRNRKNNFLKKCKFQTFNHTSSKSSDPYNWVKKKK